MTVTLQSRGSYAVFKHQAQNYIDGLHEVPAIRFDDNSHASDCFRLVAPEGMEELSASLKSQRAAAQLARLLRRETEAKRILKIAAAEHCAHLGTLAAGMPRAIARAKLLRNAARLYRAAIKSPMAPIAWLGEAEGDIPEATHLTPEHSDLIGALLAARAAVAAYKPRMVTPRWGGTPRPQYGPKFEALKNAVKTAGNNLECWITKQFNAECEKNGLPPIAVYSWNGKVRISGSGLL